jgi:hypothetical protein
VCGSPRKTKEASDIKLSYASFLMINLGLDTVCFLYEKGSSDLEEPLLFDGAFRNALFAGINDLDGV